MGQRVAVEGHFFTSGLRSSRTAEQLWKDEDAEPARSRALFQDAQKSPQLVGPNPSCRGSRRGSGEEPAAGPSGAARAGLCPRRRQLGLPGEPLPGGGGETLKEMATA